MRPDSEGDADMHELNAARQRLELSRARAAVLAPIGGNGPASEEKGLGSRIASRAKLGVASLFTARQKRFNLEVADALRELDTVVEALSRRRDRESEAANALRGEADRYLESSRAQLTGVIAEMRSEIAELRAELESARSAVPGAPPATALSAEDALATARAEQTAATALLLTQIHQLQFASEPPHWRPGTLDQSIWQSIVNGSEYNLPEAYSASDVVVDVGVHIGSFSFACLQRGAGKVYGFEANPHNYAAALTNLSRFGTRAELVNKALWRSDEPAGVLQFVASTDPKNTGGGNVLPTKVKPDWCETIEVGSVRFDDFLDGLGGRVRVLKMDCEGSEYPILLTSKRLHLIDEILGEFHEWGDSPGEPSDYAKSLGVKRIDRYALKEGLEAQGFEVRLTENTIDSRFGTFTATRQK